MMDEHLKEIAGILIAAVLVLDGLLHVYWATGCIWPASDRLALSQAVLNSNKTRLFKPATLVPLACMLFLGALAVLVRLHLIEMPGAYLPSWLLELAVLAITAGFLMLGLAGIIRALGLVKSKSRLYYRLNLIVYMPACLLLFAAAIAAFYS
ncbi:DUF3995 domain-containing protein [Paenibacillus humicola]|uniref:DUF3995 domain-containing protein n=1 Tax=Paenibacillus humicola TaxID=3110540 RepID=UPI00237A7A72|nr:DUF3995 domain-containing protein [Paenibacillus humicola]